MKSAWSGAVAMAVGLAAAAAAFLMTLADAQVLPSRNEDNNHLQENDAAIFYDTHLIPDGNEVSSYVRKQEPSWFFFYVEEDDAPLAIHIAPCSSSISVNIRYQLTTGDYDIDKPDTKDDLLSQMKSKDSDKKQPTGTLLQTSTGRGQVKFEREKSPVGLYSIEVKARDRDTTVYLYASTTPHSDRLFPALPVDANIRVISVSSDVVSVSWKPSPTDFQHRIPVEYCVSANRKRNFARRCAALASIHGDVAPTPPPNAGFGFPWEKAAEKKRRKAAARSTPAPPTHEKDRVFYACVGNKTSFTFGKLEANTLYYVDVFAVDGLTNRSSVYNGTKVTTAACEVRKMATAEAGKVQRLRTKAANCSVGVEYPLERSTAALQIEVQPCKNNERLRVKVERSGSSSSSSLSLSSSSSSSGVMVDAELSPGLPVARVSIPNARPGNYVIRVTSVERKDVAFKMAVGAVEDGLPFPVIPDDRAIRAVDPAGGSCRSLTLQWNVSATDRPQQYCLYVDRAKSRAKKGARKPEVDRCAVAAGRPRGKAKKVTCKTVINNGTHAVDSVIQLVTDLKPSTRYRFEVIARKHDGKEFAAYDALEVKTKKC